jgi:hypothetical protein
VKPEKRIKRRAGKLSVTQSTEKPGLYPRSGTSSDNRENAATVKICDERHHGFATVKCQPEKSGHIHLPQRILMAG